MEKRGGRGTGTTIAIAVGMVLVVLAALMLVAVVGGVFFLRSSGEEGAVEVGGPAEATIPAFELVDSVDSGGSVSEFTLTAIDGESAGWLSGVVTNDGDDSIILSGLSSPACGSISVSGGVVEIQPGGVIDLGNVNARCENMDAAATAGDSFPATVVFEPGGNAETSIRVTG